MKIFNVKKFTGRVLLCALCFIFVAYEKISAALYDPNKYTAMFAEYLTDIRRSVSITATPPAASETKPPILLVNADNPLPDAYQPTDLINLSEQKGKHFQLAQDKILISATVYEAMEAMFTAAQRDGVTGFIISSGYRSYDKQEAVFQSSTGGIAAKPGTSERESGLAFDVTAYGNANFELTPQFAWLSEHCGEYGFILRYPKGSESITGYLV